MTKDLKVGKIRNAEYYDMVEVFDKLYADSIKGDVFQNLYEIIISENNIKLAYRNMRKNDGGRTPGVDGMTIKDLNRMDENEFKRVVLNKFRNYHPKRVKRVEIPKPNGKMRPLGIPSIWDRVVQQCILQVLEPICEAKFFERSNGFRPNRSVENAMAQCYKMMQMYKLHYVVDVDIKGFFDNVHHGKLLKQLWSMGVQDKRVLAIISKMLKADVMLPDGTVQKSTKGTPQGGILSPLLANVVLNELDWWVVSQWEEFPARDFVEKPRPDGKGTNRVVKYKMLERSNLKKCFIVRYADDFKVFCENFEDAKRIKMAVEDFLFKRLHLEVSQEKSTITNLERHYSEFLGFKFKVIPKGNKWCVESHMCDKAIKRTKENLKEAMDIIKKTEGSANTMRAIRNYNSIVYGIHQYFRIATMIAEDVGDISYEIQHKCKSWKLKRRIKRSGKLIPQYIKEEYGHSNQLRFINEMAIIPIGYCKHKNPMYKKKSINKYTSEGRRQIHKMLGISANMIQHMLKNPIMNRSIEYNDNRISLYSAQKGKCFVTKAELIMDEMHCHHKIPRNKGGTDEYANLVLVTTEVHNLIHAESVETIAGLIKQLQPDNKSRAKIDTLRRKAKTKEIIWEDYTF
ncbi:group II intron reverse transcriptase/maturase [Blautia producta]|uniref:group II intron reverse transcriptase/maturase n=1 Tax=Blautia producta TaxID=33035 RepID=UPI0031B5C0D2